MEKVVRVNTTLYPKSKAKVMQSLREQKLTVREAAELLDVEYWEMQQI